MSSNQIALKNLVSMENLSNEEVMALIKRGIEFKNGAKAHYDEQHIVANLFFESSTRTHKAFEVAELKLGCDLLDFDVKTIQEASSVTPVYSDDLKTTLFTHLDQDAILTI